MSVEKLQKILADYEGYDTDEIKSVIRFQAFLSITDQPFERVHTPDEEATNGHVVSGAWIVNKERTKVLMIEHKFLGKWLPPGGHADGVQDPIAVALKEAEEETGVSSHKLRLLDEAPIDVDIHPFPARPQKNEPPHRHYSLFYAFELDELEVFAGNEEVTNIGWQSLDNIREFAAEDKALHRLVLKTADL